MSNNIIKITNSNFINFFQDPLNFPFKLLNNKKIGYVRISENTFIKSSFLDSRIQGIDEKIFAFDSTSVANELSKQKIASKKNLVHIFHISHVGSTLIAKLLECVEEVKVLREPNILRDFTTEYLKIKKLTSKYLKHELDELLNMILKSFVAGDNSKLVIKHTSSNLSLPIGHDFIEHLNHKEIYLYTNLKNFLSYAISSEGLQADVSWSEEVRLNAFNNLCLSNHFSLPKLGLLEKASIIWMLELSKIVSRNRTNKGLMVNFDNSFDLSSRAASIAKIIKFIFDEELINYDSILSSKFWEINPKNSEKFNFLTRTNIIRKNYQSSRFEIDSAVKWVEIICKQEPYLSSLLEYIE